VKKYFFALAYSFLQPLVAKRIHYPPLLENIAPSITFRDGEVDALLTKDLIQLLGESCVPGSIDIGFGCNDVEYIDTMVITLPAYSGCTFTSVYKKYECSAGGLFDYTMGDFQVLSHNCSAFSTALNGSYVTGAASFNAFVENFELAIYNQIQSNIIASYVPVGTYACLQGLFFNIIFIKASCYKRCIIEFSNGYASYMKIACGSDCCERHTRVCRNSLGALYIETLNAPAYPPSCDNPPSFPGNMLLSRCIRETACSYSCPDE